VHSGAFGARSPQGFYVQRLNAALNKTCFPTAVVAAQDANALSQPMLVDLRGGADSLAALVREKLRHDPFSGTIFIFRSKRADRLNTLAWAGRC
jgi:hypothetical protein